MKKKEIVVHMTAPKQGKVGFVRRMHLIPILLCCCGGCGNGCGCDNGCGNNCGCGC